MVKSSFLTEQLQEDVAQLVHFAIRVAITLGFMLVTALVFA